MSAPPAYSDNPSGQAAPLPNKKTYGAAPTDSQATDPLLAAEAGTSRVAMQGRSGNAWMGGPSADDESDDFKLGVNVIDCDAEIRLAFIRKVYSILFVQVLATCAVSLAMYHPAVKQFMQAHGWIIWIPFGGSFMTLLLTYWKRHHFPANLVLLGLFTIFEAMMIGTVTSYTDGRIVLQALFITLGVFIGLTLFTFQTKFDFSSFGPFLFAGIMGILTASLVQIFIPFNETLDLLIAYASVLLFSGFILYDTQMIMKRLNVDEYVVAVLSLYLDILNLFLNILRILQHSNDR